MCIKYLGDSDSKSFKSILERKPYGDVKISKLECVGHVQKRMGARLRKLKKDMKGRKLSDNLPLHGRNRLTDGTINLLQTYYGLAIQRNVNNINAMKKAVWAIYFHRLSTQKTQMQSLCPKGADLWCKYNRALITENNTIIRIAFHKLLWE